MLMNMSHDKKEQGLDQHKFSEKAQKEQMRRQLYEVCL